MRVTPLRSLTATNGRVVLWRFVRIASLAVAPVSVAVVGSAAALAAAGASLEVAAVALVVAADSAAALAVVVDSLGVLPVVLLVVALAAVVLITPLPRYPRTLSPTLRPLGVRRALSSTFAT
jgi:hypothetical protein